MESSDKKPRITTAGREHHHFALVSAGNAIACSLLGGRLSDETHLRQSKVVVIAEVESVVMREMPADECDAVVCEYAEVHYRTLERFKGKPNFVNSVLVTQ